MSEVKVNKITPTTNCGTVTLGDSGDTIAIPAGTTVSAPSANITNSGTVNSSTITNSGSITNSGTITNTGTISGGTITGTIDNQVNWDTTAKTTGFTAVAGNGYFVNTTSGAITVTLPASPTAGDLVGIKDYANTADTNNITIDRNGSNIQGVANNYVITIEGLAITLIYVDGTQGWVSTGAAQASNIVAPSFIIATGGTITTCGNYKIHTFTGPGTFNVTQTANPFGGPNNVDYLVVAGGGGGGANDYPDDRGAGGGGAGGYRTSFPSPAGTIPVSVTGYPVSIGGGGAGGDNTPPGGGGSPITNGGAGSNSSALSITSAGGGYGAGHVQAGGSGGSGGGGSNGPVAGGSGNTPPVSPPQGNPGGPGSPNASPWTGGGGGGASGSGTGGGPNAAGPGGNGSANLITGSSTSYAGGGGGGGGPGGTQGTGGTGGGGAGSNSPGAATSGTANTGGGGGGNGEINGSGGTGGSGIVVIRYKYQ